MSAKRVAVVACLATMLVGCSDADDGDATGLPPFSPRPSAAAPVEASPLAPSDTEQIIQAYQAYTAAVSRALAEGDADLPELGASATDQALQDARARVRANRDDGVVTAGELQPSATTAELEWSGGDEATVSDCVLNGLSHVDPERRERIVAEADGTRRPVEAVLSRTSAGWVVSHVEMPQDPKMNNPQMDPPFLRGPMPDGPPSCAPPELEQELLARYQAFWDAFDRAFGFGRDGPANPDDPALAETQVDPQLSKTRDYFRRLRAENQTSRGVPDAHDPWVLGVTDFDRKAFMADCVTLGESQTVDLDTKAVVQQNSSGQRDYYETEMVLSGASWKAAKFSIREEGRRQCE